MGYLYLGSTFTIITQSETVLVFLAAGVMVWIVRAPPRILQKLGSSLCLAIPMTSIAPVLSTTDWSVLGKIFLFFTKAGAFVFGSGLAIVPFLYGGVVKEYHWLNDRQFVDAVAVAIITPGPVVITVGFIGYLIAGLPGAIVAAVGTFLPCYLFTIIPAPYFRKYGKQPALAAFVDGVTSAAIGTITGAVFVLGERSIVDKTTAIMAVAVFLLLWKTRRLPEPVIIIFAALIGLLIYPFAQH